jgi:hypothetical protein
MCCVQENSCSEAKNSRARCSARRSHRAALDAESARACDEHMHAYALRSQLGGAAPRAATSLPAASS